MLSDLPVRPYPIADVRLHDGWPNSVFYVGDHSHFAAASWRDGAWWYASDATPLVGTKLRFTPTYFLGADDLEPEPLLSRGRRPDA